MRLRIQLGRLTIWPSLKRLPIDWEWNQSLMDPKLYGFGIWIERSMWP